MWPSWVFGIFGPRNRFPGIDGPKRGINGPKRGINGPKRGRWIIWLKEMNHPTAYLLDPQILWWEHIKISFFIRNHRKIIGNHRKS